ncbi:OmpW/AlkL family protein [Flexibacterium corallicola]|uniref:OmpW/AlkL family protein n=1 Tax=Flexibacterium corallicola TaxID=3037259 RepID=UPI00286F9D88|nr:OmpW family protein [Pseudovibrio sp. M1P-2-3]
MMGLMAATALMAPIAQASAADLYDTKEKTAAETFAAPSPWQIRVRALGVITEDDGSIDAIPGSDLSYSDTVIPELDITYFFNENIAAELILGTTKAKVYGKGEASHVGQVGDTWVLPPTLTLQYHFTNFGSFKPYIGAGVNYTIFYNQDGENVDKLDIEDTFGLALQAGFDYMFDEHWGINLDVKKIFLEPDFEVKAGNDTLTGEADLNPWLIGAGITYRF